VTDRLADFLFTPSADGDANLRKQGVPAENIHRVGNVMIDSLNNFFPQRSTARRATFRIAMPS
jgi:UDP-N-acetylglucosamine 2-epimerase (non-hydrolysing)